MDEIHQHLTNAVKLCIAIGNRRSGNNSTPKWWNSHIKARRSHKNRPHFKYQLNQHENDNIEYEGFHAKQKCKSKGKNVSNYVSSVPLNRILKKMLQFRQNEKIS